MDLNTGHHHQATAIQRFLDSHIQVPVEKGLLRLTDPNTGRIVNIDVTCLPAITGLIPSDVLTRFERTHQRLEQLQQRSVPGNKPGPQDALAEAESDFKRARATVVNALLAARKNYLTWQRVDTAAIQSKMPSAEEHIIITLTADASDPPQGYYFPEKDEAAWFKAHGRLSVDPHQIDRLESKGTMAPRLREEMAAYASDPYTRFALIRHGRFTYLMQAKKLNGRKRLFAKLVHDGVRTVQMTHWARVAGDDPVRLMKLSGIDPRELKA